MVKVEGNETLALPEKYSEASSRSGGRLQRSMTRRTSQSFMGVRLPSSLQATIDGLSDPCRVSVWPPEKGGSTAGVTRRQVLKSVLNDNYSKSTTEWMLLWSPRDSAIGEYDADGSSISSKSKGKNKGRKSVAMKRRSSAAGTRAPEKVLSDEEMIEDDRKREEESRYGVMPGNVYFNPFTSEYRVDIPSRHGENDVPTYAWYRTCRLRVSVTNEKEPVPTLISLKEHTTDATVIHGEVKGKVGVFEASVVDFVLNSNGESKNEGHHFESKAGGNETDQTTTSKTSERYVVRMKDHNNNGTSSSTDWKEIGRLDDLHSACLMYDKAVMSTTTHDLHARWCLNYPDSIHRNIHEARGQVTATLQGMFSKCAVCGSTTERLHTFALDKKFVMMGEDGDDGESDHSQSSIKKRHGKWTLYTSTLHQHAHDWTEAHRRRECWVPYDMAILGHTTSSSSSEFHEPCIHGHSLQKDLPTQSFLRHDRKLRIQCVMEQYLTVALSEKYNSRKSGGGNSRTNNTSNRREEQQHDNYRTHALHPKTTSSRHRYLFKRIELHERSIHRPSSAAYFVGRWEGDCAMRKLILLIIESTYHFFVSLFSLEHISSAALTFVIPLISTLSDLFDYPVLLTRYSISIQVD